MVYALLYDVDKQKEKKKKLLIQSPQALCGVSTGIYGYPGEAATKVALNAVRTWLQTGDNLRKLDRIVFCIFTPQLLAAYVSPPPSSFPLSHLQNLLVMNITCLVTSHHLLLQLRLLSFGPMAGTQFSSSSLCWFYWLTFPPLSLQIPRANRRRVQPLVTSRYFLRRKRQATLVQGKVVARSRASL